VFTNKLSIKLVNIILVLVIYFGGISVKTQFVETFVDSTSTIEFKDVFMNSGIGEKLDNSEFVTSLLEASREAILKISTNIFGLFSEIGKISTQILLVPFILFYFLKEDKRFAAAFIKIIPKAHQEATKRLLYKIDETLEVYISGQLTVAVIIGVLMYIGYLIIGVPNALFMGFFAMVTSIIPFVGPILGIVPALLIGLTMGGGMIIKIIVTALIVQQVEGNLITPNIMGNKLNVHPLAVIMIVIISVTLFGVLGAFVGIPLYVVMAIIVKERYEHYIFRKSNIKTDI
jgi:predicted PurR-regulated permease PerM